MYIRDLNGTPLQKAAPIKPKYRPNLYLNETSIRDLRTGFEPHLYISAIVPAGAWALISQHGFACFPFNPRCQILDRKRQGIASLALAFGQRIGGSFRTSGPK